MKINKMVDALKMQKFIDLHCNSLKSVLNKFKLFVCLRKKK